MCFGKKTICFVRLTLLKQTQTILKNDLSLFSCLLGNILGQIIFLGCHESREVKSHPLERVVEEAHPSSEPY